eukprot:CAMPEP_0181123358 /NCGR_PEP_ID=MMETSP1071-20121207/25856_1 /TAXON_ID=35127 /ORGANISM="Thalassiosira sp., Strain NH16" /LENGTH=605 /DNA_ID=CAMNT_0023208493 /DNA_START=85 /DNA_END=1899 /DNA_ORIENTATION=+
MNLPTAPSGRPPGNSASPHNSHNGKCRLNPPPPAPAPARGDISRPSKPRRDALKQHEQPPIALSNLCKIDKYYAAAEKVLGQFKTHLANSELDDAYIIGRRFALFSTVSLPKHDYYKSPKGELVRLRLKNQKDAQWVTRGLERIVEVMDKEEIDRQKAEAERLRRLREEEERQRLEWEESMRQRLGAVESSGLGRLDSEDGALDMASKLEKLNALFPKDHVEEEVDIPTTAPPVDDPSLLPPLPPPMAPPLIGEHDMALLNSVSATQQLKSDGVTPMFSESEPPNYSDLFLESLRTPSAPTIGAEELAELERLPSPTAFKPAPSPRTPIRILQSNHQKQMQSLLNSKHVDIIKLGTFQGRLSASNPRFDSTNGCAVISPLVVATHIYPQSNPQHHQSRLNKSKFGSSSTVSKYGISNSDINDIIDKRAPPILQTVRSKLGLDRHALIIPSDVHDYLVDEHILPQDKFVGVCGGDIMNKDHINELVTMLVNGKEENSPSTKSKGKKSCRKQKVGAALFFREHVISILKIPLGNGQCYYDLIDSLPNAKIGGMASRTRCKDLASFEALLRWYASSKFSETHCDFIDGNEWNDGMCDFDPRTFQGFVW